MENFEKMKKIMERINFLKKEKDIELKKIENNLRPKIDEIIGELRIQELEYVIDNDSLLEYVFFDAYALCDAFNEVMKYHGDAGDFECITFNYENENLEQYKKLVILVNKNHRIIDENDHKKALSKGDMIVLLNKTESYSSIIGDIANIDAYELQNDAYTYKSNINYGKYKYLKNFVDSIIKYKKESNLVDISREELMGFTKSYTNNFFEEKDLNENIVALDDKTIEYQNIVYNKKSLNHLYNNMESQKNEIRIKYDLLISLLANQINKLSEDGMQKFCYEYITLSSDMKKRK